MTKSTYTLDNIDHEILRILQENARINNVEISRQLGMVPSAILERIKKLENKGVITGYHARIDPQAVDKALLSFIFIKTQDIIGEQTVAHLLAEIPEVLEVHDIAGDDGYLIKVRTNDSTGLVDLMKNTLNKIEGILSTRTTIVLQTVKEESTLAITESK